MNFPESPEAAAMSFTAWLLTLAVEHGENRPTREQALQLLRAVLALVRCEGGPALH